MTELHENAVRLIKRAMKQRGVSKSELADRLGVTRPVVSHLLNGSGRSDNFTLAKLERTLIALDYCLDLRLRDSPVCVSEVTEGQ